MAVSIEELKKIKFFARLPEDLLERIIPFLALKEYLPDTPIIQYGETGTALYFIYQGSVRVVLPDSQGEIFLTRLNCGESFGEMSLLTDKPVSTTVIAETHSQILILPKLQLFAFMEQFPQISLYFIEQLAVNLRQTDEKVREIQHKKNILRKYLEKQTLPGEFYLGESRIMAETRDFLAAFSLTALPLLILGEPGCGQERLARLIHQKSPRAKQPFLIFDCEHFGPEELGFSFFGNEDPRQFGWVELAEGGTLVIKSPEKLPYQLLVRLEKLCLEGIYQPEDVSRGVKTDLRVILTSSNPERLKQKAASLLNSLEKQTLNLPPLKKRLKEIPELSSRLLQNFALKQGRKTPQISREAMHNLLAYEYPENFEELETVLERGLALCSGDTLLPEQLFFGLPVEKESRGKFDLLRIPSLGRLLRNPWFYTGIRALVLIFFLLIPGFMLSDYLLPGFSFWSGQALVLVWSVWWPLLILSALLAARVWCGFCPIGTVGRFLNKHFSLKLNLPDFFRRGEFWLPAAGFLLIIWLEYLTNMRHSAPATAFLLSGILLGSLLFSLLFLRSTWCRYLCPLGGMLAIYSAAAPLELRASARVCLNQCKTHDCYKGNQKVEGCPMYCHVLFLESNSSCQLCGNCLMSCSHQAVQLNLRLPGAEIWSQAKPALGAAVFALLLLAFFPLSLLTEFEPYRAQFGSLLSVPGFNYLFLALILLFLLLAVFALFSRFFQRISGQDFGQIFARFCLATLPLSLSAALAYQLFHLPPAGKKLFFSLGLQQNSGAVLPFLQFDPLKLLQIGLLVLGLIWSLFILYRIIPAFSAAQKFKGFALGAGLFCLLGFFFLALFWNLF